MKTYLWSLLQKLLRGRCRRCYPPLRQNPKTRKGTTTLLLPPPGPLLSLSDDHHASGDISLVAPALLAKNTPSPHTWQFVSSRWRRWDYLMKTPIILCPPTLSVPYTASLRPQTPHPPWSPRQTVHPPYALLARWQQQRGYGRIIGGRYIRIQPGYWTPIRSLLQSIWTSTLSSLSKLPMYASKVGLYKYDDHHED